VSLLNLASSSGLSLVLSAASVLSKIHHLADLRGENVEPSDSFTGAAAGTLSWLKICDMF